MSTNFTQRGDVVTVTAPAGGLSSGDPVQIGEGLFGIATHDAAAGAECEIARFGVFTIPSDNALTFAVGDRVYWDATNGEVDKTAASQLRVGVSMTAAATPTSIDVLLIPSIADGA